MPEPSSKVRGSSAGVTGAVSLSDLDVVYGVGIDARVGSCAYDLGCGIGGGGVSTHSGLSQEIIKLLLAKINKIFLFLPVIPVMAIVHMKIKLNKI